MFELHPQLAQDCVVIGDFSLTRALLSKDSLYPWLILVPRREGLQEVYRLTIEDQQQLLSESNAVSALMMSFFNADKLNIAALGNMVPQLHIHHIARFKDDPAWPKPVWGQLPAVPYSDKVLDDLLDELRREFSEMSLDFKCV